MPKIFFTYRRDDDLFVYSLQLLVLFIYLSLPGQILPHLAMISVLEKSPLNPVLRRKCSIFHSLLMTLPAGDDSCQLILYFVSSWSPHYKLLSASSSSCSPCLLMIKHQHKLDSLMSHIVIGYLRKPRLASQLVLLS